MCKNPTKHLGYNILSSAEEVNTIIKKVLVPKIISQDSTIEIARQLRLQSKMPEKAFVSYFYQPGMTLDIAWVAVTHHNDSTNQMQKGKDGVWVEFHEVMPEFAH